MNQHKHVLVRRPRWGRLAAVACLSIGLCASGAVALSTKGPTGHVDQWNWDQASQLTAEFHASPLIRSEAQQHMPAARLGANATEDTPPLHLAAASRFSAARARVVVARYRNKVLCIGAPNRRGTTTIINNTPGATRNCQIAVPLDGLSVDGRSGIVRFGAAGQSFQMPGGPTLACEDPDGDFEHCNGVCSSTPATQESGTTGCSLGCLARYIWDKSWCD